MTIKHETSIENWTVATIVCEAISIRWEIRDSFYVLSCGTDLLSSTNGCYDSLLSNVVNKIHSAYKINEFIFRRNS